jgi:hypothetical protein
LLVTVFGVPSLAVQAPCAQPTNQAPTQPANSAAPQRVVPDRKLIESLLKQQFQVIKQKPSSSNPFPTLVPRSSKENTLDAIDNKYEVVDVRLFEDKCFFRHQKILLVTVSDIFLEARIKVAHRSVGMFALNGKKLSYLNGIDSASKVSDALKRENCSLSDADPQMLANFFAMTILRQGNGRVDVVQSPNDILILDKPNAAMLNKKMKEKGFERLYATTVDKSELEKCKGQFTKPQLSYDQRSGWRSHFVGLRGFMHTIHVPFALMEYDISVSPAFRIKVTEHILSARIIT